MNQDWNNLYWISLLNYSNHFYHLLNAINIDKGENNTKVQLIITKNNKQAIITYWFQKPNFYNSPDKVIISKSNLDSTNIVIWIMCFIVIGYLIATLLTIIYFIFYLKHLFKIK
ncbi:hypothetical protein [Spiroplasma culicicola]|uniref:Transmembrane protein n=1 Tax=Spiroplasma culicicola AES-1 TaxID=1276246 RepID=W6A7K3_9MOLU|nr:hypothetical protein [Spiroplasma culicicola]AHI52830.1 hypothetical protein SCULI_v1c04890 [Spiroplasma culicicola AES-1]